MTARLPDAALEDHGVLRFITAGSVDDGKSTLIGRLLYDSRGILKDQLAALARAAERRPGANTVAGLAPIDLSLLTDGLEAEREQGITIDVAYRYFATAQRKFIIADTPGHEQYTRNMVTAASTADAAVILVDATRVKNGELLAQTRRHAALAHLLGIRQVVVAVNKMDRLGFDRDAFEAIVAAYRALAGRLGAGAFSAIPVSALDGDNVVTASDRMSWYAGPTLLAWLEGAPSEIDALRGADAPFRFPVQLALRGYDVSDGSARGYAGRVASGSVRVGAEVQVQPNGATARIAAIETHDGRLAQAFTGQSVSLRLDRELDVSRGDLIVAAAAPVRLASRFEADLAWLDDEPARPGARLWLRHGARNVAARVRRVDRVLDLQQVEWRDAVPADAALARNDIARVEIETQQPLAIDAYDAVRAGGAFVLVDTASHRTVAAGMIRTPHVAAG
ncbi:MAG: 50S ribosome-binding GTPase [Burkholderiales bacterium]|nr:50S ribosome-binding GTPase [Burkholderiales bacterium]